MKYCRMQYLLILFLFYCSIIDSNTVVMVVKPTGANTIDVKIASNKEEAEGSRYTVEYALMPGDNWVIVDQCIFPIKKGNYSCTIMGLKAITTYNIKLYACVQGPVAKMSNEMMTVPTTTKLNESTITNINNRKSNSVTVNYSKADGDTGINLKYFVTYGAATIVGCPSSGYACNVTELTPNTEYSFKVVICPTMSTTVDEKCSESSMATSAFTLPGIPLTGKVIKMTSSSLLVSWTPPSPNGGQLADYNVRTSPHDRTCVGKSSCELSQLTSAYNYTVNIRACRTTDECGGPYTLNAQTKPGESNITNINNRKSNSVTVNYAKAAGDTGSNLKYFVTYGATTIVDCPASSYACNVTELTPNTGYSFKVVVCPKDAETTDETCSQPSISVSAFTLPGIPLTGKVIKMTSSSLLVSWTPPSPNGGPLADYNVRTSPHDRTCVGKSSCELSQLTSATKYTINIRACRTTDECGEPYTLNAQTKPGESNITNINNRKSNSVTVNYAKAAGDTGSNLKYVITYGATTIVDCPASGYACTVTELTPNTEYSFKLVVCPKDAETTDETCSQPSISVSAFTLPGIPLTGKVIKMTSLSLLVSWTPPSPNGGQLADYNVRTSPHDRTCVGISSCELTQLTSATKYTINIRACRTTDECGEPYTLNAQTKPGESKITNINNRKSNSVTVNYAKAAGDTGSNLKYFVTYDATTIVDCPASGYACTVTELTPNTEYSFKVIACPKDAGTLDDTCSEPSIAVSAFTLPGTPTNIIVSETTATSVSVSWKYADGGGTIGEYHASAALIAAVKPLSTICKPSFQPCTINGLEGNTEYTITVEACSKRDGIPADECGEPSKSEVGKTKINAPTGFKILSIETQMVKISWSVPTQNVNNLKDNVEMRNLEDSTVLNVSLKISIGARQTELTSLMANTRYSIKMCSCSSTQIDCVCAQSELTARTYPVAPKISEVKIASPEAFDVSWQAAAQTTTNLKYQAEVAPGLPGKKNYVKNCFEEASSTTLFCQVDGLLSNTRYQIEMCAYAYHSNGELYIRQCDTDIWKSKTWPRAPSSIDVTQRTSYSLLVTWTNLEPVSSLLDNMTVTAKPTPPDVMNERQCFVKWADHLYTCELSNLAPCTEFIVDVVACAAAEGAYPSLCSQPTEINSATLAEAPRNVTIGDVTSDSVKVSWPAATSCKVDKYRASAIPIAKSDEEKFCEGSGQDNSCQIVGLQSEATYIISVQSCAMDPVTNSITCGDPVLSEHLITNRFINIALIVGLCLLFIALIIVAILGFIYRRPISIFVASKMLQEKPKPISPRVEDNTFGRIFYAELDPNADFTNKIPPPIPFESFKAFVAGLSKVNAFSEQYKLIDDLAVEQATTYKLTTYVPNENPNLNRYIHMESYDQSMVLLNYDWETIRKNPRPQIPLDANTDTMYINASFVRTCHYNSQGRAYVSEQSPIAQYIACQAPMTHTVADFHTMIYNYRVPLVVMLCTETQKGKPKCARYWPDGSEQEFFSQYRTIRVCKLKEDILPNFTVRILTVCPHDQTQSWKFTQIQFLKWEDHGVPDASIFCELLDKCINTRQLCPMGDFFGPTVVHCSAGVGRTGTFICANMLLDRLRVAPESIDVCGTVLAVRKYRKTMVQTPSQLQFLYDIIMHVIDKENIQIGQVPSNTTEPEYENMKIVTHIDPYHDNEYANMGEGENGIA